MLIVSMERWNSLIRKTESKKRKCLKCGKSFQSFDGDHTCELCQRENKKFGKLLETI